MKISNGSMKGKNLYDLYEEKYKDGTWSYYKIDEINPNDFPFMNSNSKKFISDYYERGGKSILLEPDSSLNEIRAKHTVSTFLLGFIIREYLGIQENELDLPPFKYLWFLACLYHDNGYAVENGKKSIPEFECQLFKDDLFNNEAMPDNLFPELIKGYDSYRNNKDHGIVGGKMLYNALKKNYYNKKKDIGNEKETFYDVINGKKLCLSNEHFPHYFEASMAIVMHNIWLTKPDKKNSTSFEHNGLDPLIGTKYKFSKELSLFFILLLADTIEPLKRFPKYQHNEILKNIYINIEKDGLLISYDKKLKINKRKRSKKCIYNWKKAVIGITTFMEIRTEKRENAIFIYKPD